MSWFKLLKADNVKIDADDESTGFYDPQTDETTLNLARALDIQDIITAETHEELHKVTVADIEDELFEYVSNALNNIIGKEHFRSMMGNSVMFTSKGMTLVIDTISDKVANSIAFHEILTHAMTFESTNDSTLNQYKDQFDNDIEITWANVVFPLIEGYAKRATGLENPMPRRISNLALGQKFIRVVRDKVDAVFKKHTDKNTDWMKSLQSHNIGTDKGRWSDA